MTRLPLLLPLVFLLSTVLAPAQEIDAPDGTPIAAADVSGLSIDQLSPGLRRDIGALIGTPVNRQTLDALAARIEQERPEAVAAARALRRPEGDARVLFLVGRITDDRDLSANINARYVVESAEIEGVEETAVSQSLRDAMQALVGRRLDPDEADRLDERLASELPDRRVQRRISRGSEPGRIRVIFDVGEELPPRWIPFAAPRSKLVYHSDLAWSAALEVPLGGRDHRVAFGFVFGDEDEFLESQSGIGVRFESRHVGTRRIGAELAVARYRQVWEGRTLEALAQTPSPPEPYRARLMLEPALSVAFTSSLRARFGVSVSELDLLSRSPESVMASAAVAGLTFDRRVRSAGGAEHRGTAAYEVRAGTRTLESDLIYTRHVVRGSYEYRFGRSTIVNAVTAGRLSGAAPLFERFVLGDTRTLRGWEKYEIAPIGGDRLVHHTAEYRYRGLAIFLDTGSLWTAGADRRVRASTGFGYTGDHAFLTLGFPLNAGEVRAAFMAGVRF